MMEQGSLKYDKKNIQQELEQLTQSDTGSLHFTNDQINFMQDHLGDLDSKLRDNTIFTLFARGFMEDGFTNQQMEQIINQFLNQEAIFNNIDKDTNNEIFLRSFNALLGAVILDKDNLDGFLSKNQQNKFFKFSIKYLQEERDYRGFVKPYGWAHGVAHGSDFLASALTHSKFNPTNTEQILNLISVIIRNIKTPFIDGEEVRIANAFFLGVKSGSIDKKVFNNFIIQFDKTMWTNYNDEDLTTFYQLNTWFHLLTNWFFFFSEENDTDNLLHQLINKYYQHEGFIER